MKIDQFGRVRTISYVVLRWARGLDEQQQVGQHHGVAPADGRRDVDGRGGGQDGTRGLGRHLLLSQGNHSVDEKIRRRQRYTVRTSWEEGGRVEGKRRDRSVINLECLWVYLMESITWQSD